jgi:hypothetical protein
MSENLCLKSVRDLCAKDSALRSDATAAAPQCPFDSNVSNEDENIGTYYIPSFQRGYRWTRLQVRQLVEDLREFYGANNRQTGAWYCLQPLVVIKECNEVKTEKHCKVIDGQQRLTTLFLIIKYLAKSNPYRIEYETRLDCWHFLENIGGNENAKVMDNPDFFCISKAWVEIDTCLSGYDDEYKKKFCQTILDSVKVIWYETSGNPYEEFTRLNSGKIALSNAELIKALLLKELLRNDNRKLSQLEVAQEWDMMERTLHNDDFWCFINPDFSHERFYATRIDFIYEMVLRKDQLADNKYLSCICATKKEAEAPQGIKILDELDRNPYYIFGVFQEYCKKAKSEGAIEVWRDIQDVFRRIRLWYEDRDLFHRIGYLMNRKGEDSEKKLKQLAGWLRKAHNNTKPEFLKLLNETIQKSITKILPDLRYGDDNSMLNDVLLLFNIAIMMRQQQENSRYPFREHIQASWTLEHIHAKQERSLQNEDLKYIAKQMMVDIRDVHGEELIKCINCKLAQIGESMHIEQDKENKEWLHLKDSKELHGIGNLALLGHKANASFNNSLFFEKRKILSRWGKGEREDLKKSGFDNVEFVPVATKMVFFKHFSQELTLPFAWTEIDADNYVSTIVATLKSIFGFNDNQLVKSGKEAGNE